MKKNALWFAAVAAGVAAVTYKFATSRKKSFLEKSDSAQSWISSAEERLRKINLKLHSNDSVA